jgi:hypothetical protein
MSGVNTANEGKVQKLGAAPMGLRLVTHSASRQAAPRPRSKPPGITITGVDLNHPSWGGETVGFEPFSAEP